MSDPLFAVWSSLAILAVMSFVLVVYKGINGWRKRFEAVSRASYIAVFGELTARGSYPQEILSAWTEDHVFRSALVDFLRLLDGVERDRLLRVARDIGLVDSAVVRLRKGRLRKTRIRAAALLAELADPKTIRPLMAAMQDPESGVRINASAALAKMGDPDVVEVILEGLDQESEWDAARTMDHLTSIGAPAVDGLIAYLGDLTERVPVHAALAVQALGEIGDLRAEPTALHALASKNPEMRLAAAAALRKCGSQRCVGPLIAAMDDADGRVRARAAKSLGEHFDERAVNPLYDGLHDREWWVRKNSAASLARLPGGVAGLQRAVRSNDHFARDAAREQLMMLGIPAGSETTSPAAGSAEPAGDTGEDWIQAQLRALETSGQPPDATTESLDLALQSHNADQPDMPNAG